jgi:hypothetical protein
MKEAANPPRFDASNCAAGQSAARNAVEDRRKMEPTKVMKAAFAAAPTVAD